MTSDQRLGEGIKKGSILMGRRQRGVQTGKLGNPRPGLDVGNH